MVVGFERLMLLEVFFVFQPHVSRDVVVDLCRSTMVIFVTDKASIMLGRLYRALRCPLVKSTS